MTDPNNPLADVELIEIYATHNIIDVQVLEDLLSDNDILHMTRKIETSPFPMSVGLHGEHRLSVDEAKIQVAVGLIKQAIADGAVQLQDAEFLVAYE